MHTAGLDWGPAAARHEHTDTQAGYNRWGYRAGHGMGTQPLGAHGRRKRWPGGQQAVKEEGFGVGAQAGGSPAMKAEARGGTGMNNKRIAASRLRKAQMRRSIRAKGPGRGVRMRMRGGMLPGRL